MNINNNNPDFFDRIDNDLKKFSLLDNFNLNKRSLILSHADEILDYIATGKATPSQIQRLNELKGKLIQQSKGGAISNFFLNLFGKGKQLLELNDRSLLIDHEFKKINKLIKNKASTIHLPQFLKTENAKNLENLLFDDHIYERMAHFGHTFSFNAEGKVVFKFSDRAPLDVEVPEDTIEDIEDPETYWDELYDEFADKDITLEIRGEFNDGRYMNVPISEINPEQLKQLLIQEDGSFNKSIQIIYPPKELTFEELEEQGILECDEETNEYFIASEYQYLENGFVSLPDEEWEHLRPYAYTSTPPKEFTIDIIVHSKPGLPGVFMDQGHASVKITTPKGEIYSVGFFPGDLERDPYNLSMQKGKLITPDTYLFLPSTSYEQHVMSYTLSDPKAFHKIVNWIEAAQGYNKEEETEEVNASNLFYHPTHQSCASFASTLRDYALELGAKSQTLSQHKVSNWTRLSIRIKEIIMNFAITNFFGKKKFQWDQGIEHADIKNYNITHLDPKGLYLPVDLILDQGKEK